MLSLYGTRRVIEPKHVLPTSAWRVDNSREIYANELRLRVKRIHIESSGFRQICIESGNSMEKIKDRIIDIIIKRGKLHNPVTETGGVVYGTVEAIGDEYTNTQGLEIGDEVICNVSLAGIPLYLSHISNIDMAYTQIDCDGYAILFNDFPIVRKPQDVPVNLMLYTFDESATLHTASRLGEGKKRCLVVGNSLLTNLLYGLALRKTAGEEAEIVCLFDNNTDIGIRGKQLSDLLENTFSHIHYVNITKPVECLENLDIDHFDLSINCADIPGAETINILCTKEGGTVLFANLINNYNIALYITEAISREIHICCAMGYDQLYDQFDIEIIRQIAPYLQDANLDSYQIQDNIAYSLRKNKKNYEQQVQQKTYLDDFICQSRAMATVVDEILSVAKYDCNVLITGDTGVGKEKVASLIQKNSGRNTHPYIKINCAAISENLIESEFFGYEKGAFTGANATGKKGYFELADNGIIFLDEVGELPLDMQAKLLRVIQDGEFFKVGGSAPVKTNVRILSATNRNLEEQIDLKLFRRDLYYRLNVFPIRVPSLMERKEEIPALASHFLKKYNEKFGTEKSFSMEALDYLKSCSWPGNIRELENAVQRLLISSKGDRISVMTVMRELNVDLVGKVEEFDPQSIDLEKGISLDEMVNNFERDIIKYAYDKFGSSRKAAKAIGISQTQMVRKRKKYDIHIGEEEMNQ